MNKKCSRSSYEGKTQNSIKFLSFSNFLKKTLNHYSEKSLMKSSIKSDFSCDNELVKEIKRVKNSFFLNLLNNSPKCKRKHIWNIFASFINVQMRKKLTDLEI